MAFFKLDSLQSHVVASTNRTNQLLQEKVDVLKAQVRDLEVEQAANMNAVQVGIGLALGLEEIPKGAHFAPQPDGLWSLAWDGEAKFKKPATPTPPNGTATPPEAPVLTVLPPVEKPEGTNGAVKQDAPVEKIPDPTPEAVLAKSFVDTMERDRAESPVKIGRQGVVPQS